MKFLFQLGWHCFSFNFPGQMSHSAYRDSY